MSDTWLLSVISKHANSGIFPDSNLLFVYLVGTLDPALVGKQKGTREYTAQDFEFLDRFIARFQPIYTTPNVITEVSNLAGRMRADITRLFRALLQKASLQLLQEEYITSKDATNHPIYQRLGVTDAAIAMVASHGILVLTNDLDLSISLEDQQVDCIHYNRMLRPIVLEL